MFGLDRSFQSKNDSASIPRRRFLAAAAAGAAALAAGGRVAQASFPEQPDVAEPIGKSLSDEELLDLVQRQTLKYFWDFAHPVSGMARERSNSTLKDPSLEIVTTGGTGFGIMAMLAGAERGFLPRAEVLQRIDKITDFLGRVERYHGAFPHHIKGTTGGTCPFSTFDDGGDLVETAFLMMGLLCARQYFSGGDEAEIALREKINGLWRGVEWNWYTRGQDVLYWHWSPQHEWKIGWPIQGWHEGLMAYVLAASSPTHSVGSAVYSQGWARASPFFRNGESYYNIPLPLGMPGGGPLFFAHYSFMGLDPRGLKDGFADYWVQNVNHTQINRAHCVANPHHYVGYGDHCWGLTASYNDRRGYDAHSPANDQGVIAPTAALSSMPYTPAESMRVMRHLYESLGDRLWSEYGFRDAFNESAGWVAPGHLAIDQGPIIVMIENHRSQLLWNLFMSCPEVQAGLRRLDFESPHLAAARAVPQPPQP